MAQAKTLKFSGYVILVENPANPGVYVKACGFTERSLSRSKSLNETNVPDCADEDVASWVEREVVAKSWNINANGVLAEDAEDLIEAWWSDDDAWNVEVQRIFTGGLGTKRFRGTAHLESVEDGASRGSRVTRALSIAGTGALTSYVGP